MDSNMLAVILGIMDAAILAWYIRSNNAKDWILVLSILAVPVVGYSLATAFPGATAMAGYSPVSLATESGISTTVLAIVVKVYRRMAAR